MTSKERVTTLLKREIPDRMGLYEHFWPETLRDFWPGQGYTKDEKPEYYFDYDIINCGGGFNSEPFLGQKKVIEETEEWQIIKDGRGATLKHWKNNPVPRNILILKCAHLSDGRNIENLF